MDYNQMIPPSLDSALNTYFAGQVPDPCFSASLEERLRMHHSRLISSDQQTGQSKRSAKQTYFNLLRTRPLLAVLAAILVLLAITGFVYAVTWLSGFIPDIGFVEDVQSVLVTPVEVSRSLNETPVDGLVDEANKVSESSSSSSQNRYGITVTVKQAVADSDRLTIVYEVTGLPPNFYSPDLYPNNSLPVEEEPMPDQIRLPDGSALTIGDGSLYSGTGDLDSSTISCRVLFYPLPEGINEFTLVIDRLYGAMPGELPEDWEIPVSLSPVSDTKAVSALEEPDLSSKKVNGITLHLLKASQGPYQSAFQLGMEWEGQDRYIHHFTSITMQDQNGKYYILSSGPDSGSFSADKANFMTLSSLISTPLTDSIPITFTIKDLFMSLNKPAGFMFDPGKNAKIGQEWELDEHIEVGEFELHITKARMKTNSEGLPELEFDFDTLSNVISINLTPEVRSSSVESGYDEQRGVMVSRCSLPEIPQGPVKLMISEVIYKVEGPWQVTWKPKQVDFGGLPTATPLPVRRADDQILPLVQDEPLLIELQNLLSRSEEKDPSGPGWVHQVQEIDQAPSMGVLDTGDLPEQPLQYRADSWYLLDEEGYKRTSIVVRKDLDGNFLSADISNGIYHFSFPEGRGGFSQDIYLEKPSYNLNLLSVMNGYITEGGSIREERGSLDGTPYRLFIATLPYDPPQIFVGEAAPVKAMIYSACINPTDGRVLETQGWMEYTNGATSEKNTTSFLLLEKVDTLPAEVQALLDQLVMP